MNPTVSHFTFQVSGGAGIAARRLHLALCRAGVKSQLYFGEGESVDSTMVPAFQNHTFFWRNAAALANSWHSRREAPGGFVTSPKWIRKTPLETFGNAPQIVNLHSVLRWLDLPSFFRSLPSGLPAVWTLHDLIPVTGGCHYPGECDHFTNNCGNCPQQKRPAPSDDTHKFFDIKNRCYSGKNLHFVGNSEWTTAQIQRSALARHAKSIRTIHLGIDPQQYQPINKTVARRALGISEGKFVVGFACSDFSEQRKGAHILGEALKSLPAKETVVLILGTGRWPKNITNVETVYLGSVASPRFQSIYYSALDVFAMPSLFETFGLVALEAMACETPVIAYSTSGVKDVVVSNETGLLEKEIGSIPAFTRMLQWMREHAQERATMGAAARHRVVEKFSDSLMADHYTQLYHELAVVD